ncbi:hypothetical protein KCP91_18990 [Microvirga sp. SRT01]|jgi:hypothetical protein|uniref:Uncharacterized protein n=1 Tax=Sphingomonas longa TaxID=2778730 RepID=A0ABS2DC00_9SPHN|nr:MULTISPECIES: hypothetical protein [Alphaproteobacteria]MBM6578475.1 hypothetical protein [Sphingomonas sp. BT552]MBR7711515.1 hypothetical protein [Microvirga sp. SRT01]
MKLICAFLTAALTAPLAARDLNVPVDKGWMHAETGIVLRPQLAGLMRTALQDATQSERDVTAQFGAPDKSVVATIYVFRPAIADVGMWFDRSRTALEGRSTFKNTSPATADPVAFAAGGSSSLLSLRQVYASPDGPFRSTALAVVPVGQWIVGIRMSAATLSAGELDGRLLQVISAIKWPNTSDIPSLAATPINACATPIAFHKAKQIKPSGSEMLMSLIGGSMVAKQQAEQKDSPAPISTWCRNGTATTEYGIYQSDGRLKGYVLALYDAGRVVSVYPSIMGQIDDTGTYSVTLEDVDGTVSTFPSFSALPDPKQVWELINKVSPSGFAKGKTITLDPKSLR